MMRHRRRRDRGRMPENRRWWPAPARMPGIPSRACRTRARMPDRASRRPVRRPSFLRPEYPELLQQEGERSDEHDERRLHAAVRKSGAIHEEREEREVEKIAGDIHHPVTHARYGERAAVPEGPVPVQNEAACASQDINHGQRGFMAEEARGQREIKEVQSRVAEHPNGGEACQLASHAHGSRLVVFSRTRYVGRAMLRRCMRARYSPMMPSAKSCTPAKIAMTEARKGNPGTLAPRIRYTIRT